MNLCRRCNKPLPPATGPREREWCSDACRKAAGRDRPSGDRLERPLPAATNVREAVDTLLTEVAFEEGDPRAVISVIVKRLAEEFDARPSASVARELKSGVSWLVENPNATPGFVDELRARRLARRVDYFVRDDAEDGT